MKALPFLISRSSDHILQLLKGALFVQSLCNRSSKMLCSGWGSGNETRKLDLREEKMGVEYIVVF